MINEDIIKAQEKQMSNYEHYYKNVKHLSFIDVYRVIDLFGVTSAPLQHAIKKLLCAGYRGVKDHEKDIREAIDALNRHLQMIAEDSGAES